MRPGGSVLDGESSAPHGASRKSGDPAVNGIRAGSRLPLLLIAFLATGWVFFRVASSDPDLRTWLRVPLPASRPSGDDDMARLFLDRDPGLGTVLPLPARPVAHDGERLKAYLVIMIGSCSECALSHMAGADGIGAAVPGLKTIGIANSSEAQISSFRAAHHLKMEIVSDPSRKLSLRYNAAWTPRAYLLSPRRELLWRQTRWFLNPEEVAKEAKSIVQERHR